MAKCPKIMTEETSGTRYVCGREAGHEGEHYFLRESLSPALPVGDRPERDARQDAYRDRERRRAARALDRYMEAIREGAPDVHGAAGERFVEAVGDYVLARLGDDVWTSAHRAGLHADMWVEKCAMCLPGDDPRPNAHKSNYGAGDVPTCMCDAWPTPHPFRVEMCEPGKLHHNSARYIDPEGGSNNVHERPSHNADCGAPGPCYLTGCARDASGACARHHNDDVGAER